MISILNDYCSQLEHTLALHDPSQDPESEMFIERQLTRLATYIQTNKEEIWGYLLLHKEAQSLFQRIHQLDCKDCKISSLANQLKNIQTSCAFLELKVLLQEKDVTKIADWVILNKKGINPNSNTQILEIFENLNKAKDLLLKTDLLTPDVGSGLSHLITCGLGLNNYKNANYVKSQLTQMFGNDTQLKLQALTHWINAEKIPLKDAGLSLNELQAIAPYLHYVDCRKLELDDPEKFISSCSNAYHLFIQNDKLKELKQLPLQLQTLDCSNCRNLKTLDVSKNLQLQVLQCSDCPITALDVSKNLQLQGLYCWQCPITALDVSKNSQLQKLYCWQCPITALDVSKNIELQVLQCSNCPLTTLDISKNIKLQVLHCSNCPLTTLDLSKNIELQKLYCWKCPITTLDVSENPQLQVLECTQCPNLRTLDVSKNLQLQKLYCWQCPITALDVSKNLQLQEFSCSKCPITALDVSKNLQLQKLDCKKCSDLTTLGDSLSNTLRYLDCSNCPNLAQLPQLVATAIVYSSNTRCGNLTFFRVNPKAIDEQPLQVLLQLGEHLLENRPFPNIVYLDPITNKPSQGLDAGGLRRQLVATLCKNLFKDNSGFPFIKEISGATVPVLNDLNNNSSVRALRTFARIMAFSATSNLLMGTNIATHFFFGIFSLSDNDFKTPYNEETKKIIYRGYQGLDILTNEDLAEIEKETPLINAIAIVTHELKTVLGNQFGQWRNNTLAFINKVQGTPVNTDNLKANILCGRLDYKRWIDEFIDDLANKPLIVEKDNIQKVYGLKEFLMLMTGAYSLGTHPIKVKVYPSRKFLESSITIHTCTQTIEMPGDLTKESLQNELRSYLLLAKGFNAA